MQTGRCRVDKDATKGEASTNQGTPQITSKPPEARGGPGRRPAAPCPHLDFGRLASRPRPYISVSGPVCVLFRWPQEMRTLPGTGLLGQGSNSWSRIRALPQGHVLSAPALGRVGAEPSGAPTFCAPCSRVGSAVVCPSVCHPCAGPCSRSSCLTPWLSSPVSRAAVSHTVSTGCRTSARRLRGRDGPFCLQSCVCRLRVAGRMAQGPPCGRAPLD